MDQKQTKNVPKMEQHLPKLTEKLTEHGQNMDQQFMKK